MRNITIILLMGFYSVVLNAQEHFAKDTIVTERGDLVISFIGHGTLYFTFNNKVVHIDPVDRYADYTKIPKADYIFVTHHHGDHFQSETVDMLLQNGTELFFTKICADKYAGEGVVVANGETLSFTDFSVEVVPAYNVVHKRESGELYHPKGDGNGYVFTFGNKRVYVAGDTENFSEMNELHDIDIAFLPMNLPYTMTPEMVAEAVKVFKPKVLYPYHYGNTDVNKLLDLLSDQDYCEVRIRDMK